MCIKLVFHGEWHGNSPQTFGVGAAWVSTGYDSSAVWWSFSGTKNKKNDFSLVPLLVAAHEFHAKMHVYHVFLYETTSCKRRRKNYYYLICVLETPARTTCAAAYYCVRSLQNASKLKEVPQSPKASSSFQEKPFGGMC